MSKINAILGESDEFNGSTFQQLRKAASVSIEQLWENTRILPQMIEAIEADDYKSLPAPIYVKGFLKSFLDSSKLQ